MMSTMKMFTMALTVTITVARAYTRTMTRAEGMVSLMGRSLGVWGWGGNGMW